MKRMDNRQNKTMSIRPVSKTAVPERSSGKEMLHARAELPAAGAGRVIYGLLKDLFMAMRIAKHAQHCHLGVHHFDEAAKLLEHCRHKLPAVILMDFDQCEREAYQALSELRKDPALAKIPAVGFVSREKSEVKREAERAGCHRVYLKTEFLKSLEDILVRYAL